MGVLRARVRISGRVQGVAFRFSTLRQARKQGVAGWVRNLSNGQVEAVFEGDRDAVEQTVAWCHKGPISAHVDQVDVEWEEGEARYTGFDVRH